MNAPLSFNAGALVAPLNIEAICMMRERALSEMEEAIAAIAKGYALARGAAETAKGATAGHASYLHYDDNQTVEKSLYPDFDTEKTFATYKRTLDAAIWRRIVEETRLKEIMDRTERDQLDKQMAANDMPEPTFETIRATLARLTGEANLIFQRGVARAFASLSPAFKSHDAFKINKRMIFEWVFSEGGYWSYSGHGEQLRRTLADVERVFSQLAGNRSYGALERAIGLSRRGGYGARQSEVESEYFLARTFKNGNLHLWIKDEALLRKVNRVLADYYGEVLPDAAGAEAQPADFRPGTALAKDLAFYPTPAEVVDYLLDGLRIEPSEKVLEPSAGIGALVRPLLAQGANVDAIEVHPDRAEVLRGIAHPALSVKCANFLKLPARPIYDCVVMNPPFYHTTWADHVRHAFDFLKPGGELRAILPASAEVGSTAKHERFRAWAESHAPRGWRRGLWRDLPAESFASVGVRINTVVLTLTK
ncbi:DUF4942 domain-containing protein [Paracoccus sediminicola]|uniref:DUF4942 domain-containing protein n=1 Tax=Paracoccus sediminicola TaxID=3017783 RepID=UPI0022F04DDE|nr:DUF4942 domain-containing protein [Paracoccus sediminicola]WBU58589.1 DUF4942 domain-containing protein [Paracoccus sediminicola]